MNRIILFILIIPIISFSHSGRTDSNGGHTNRKTGEYHYHHGCSAHSHDGGCPYDYENCRNGGSRSSYSSKTNWYVIFYVFGAIFLLLIVVPYSIGEYGRFRDKKRKLKNERLEKDNRHKTYLFLKRKQYNQNDEYIPNQLTAKENIQYNELKEEFSPKLKIVKTTKPINQKDAKGAYRTELRDGKLYSYTFFESVLLDLEDLFLFKWILKRIKNKNIVTKILLVILLSPFYLGVYILLWFGGLTIFVWLFAKIGLLIIKAYNLTSSFF